MTNSILFISILINFFSFSANANVNFSYGHNLPLTCKVQKCLNDADISWNFISRLQSAAPNKYLQYTYQNSNQDPLADLRRCFDVESIGLQGLYEKEGNLVVARHYTVPREEMITEQTFTKVGVLADASDSIDLEANPEKNCTNTEEAIPMAELLDANDYAETGNAEAI